MPPPLRTNLRPRDNDTADEMLMRNTSSSAADALNGESLRHLVNLISCRMCCRIFVGKNLPRTPNLAFRIRAHPKGMVEDVENLLEFFLSETRYLKS